MLCPSQITSEKLVAVMLLVYGDESLDATQSRVCAVAGVIGTEDDWKELETKWVARNGSIPFHATDCESDQGDYKATPHRENKALYQDLAILLAESGLGGYASSQDLAAQRKAFPSPYEPPLYYQGFLDVIEIMRNAAEDRGEIAEFTFDSRIESQFNATEIYSYLLQSGLYSEEHLAKKLSFDAWRSNARIQVADLLAYEAMKELDNKVGPVKRNERASWTCLKSTGRFAIEVFGEEYFSNPNMQPDTLNVSLGFKQQEYLDWIDRKKVPHCYTSFLRFLFEMRDRMTDDQKQRLDGIHRRGRISL